MNKMDFAKLQEEFGANANYLILDFFIEEERTLRAKEKIPMPLGEKRYARVVFKDGSFADTNVKTNAIQVLKQFDIDEVVSI